MASLLGQIVNGQVIVKVWLSVPVVQTGQDNIWLPSRALIDTGATISGVSDVATSALLYSVTSRGLVIPFTHGNLATATKSAEKVLMYEVDMALGIERESTFQKIKRKETNWIYHTLKVSVVQPGLNHDMLLGMDFLQYCHLSMNKELFILSN